MIKLALKVIILLCLPVLGHSQTVIVDNSDTGFSIENGIWVTGTATGGKYGADYRYANTVNGAPTARARFTPTLPATGYYYVSVWYNTGSNRATNAPYTVHGDLATSTVLVNQQLNGAMFFYIGQTHFQAGNSGYISLANNADNSVVMADAIQLVYAGPTPGPEPGGPTQPGGIENPELRGLWVSRFEWPRSTQVATKAMLDTIINTMANANFNSLFLQVRGQMDTLYPSPNEPWASAGFGYQPQNYDPMAYAITKTHQAGMKFHAYINTHVISQGAPPPTNLTPVHPYYTHGNPASASNSDWVFHVNGMPQPLGEGEENYNWTAPGSPSFQKWTRDQVLYVAENYPVDGVHFDRIRFAGTVGSTDPVSVARGATGNPANPANLSFRNWNRDQITRLLSDIYGAVAEVNYHRPPGKPFIEVSTAPFRGPSQQAGVNQLVGEWNAIGGQDFVVPQIYTSSITSFESLIEQNQAQGFGRHTVAGMSRNSTGNFETTVEQIEMAREKGSQGTVIFSYTAFASSEFPAFANTIYTKKVPTPAMEWITTPTLSIIVGNITGPGSEPILDAQITRNGSTYKWLSGSDGFYSMLKTPASQPITLTVTKAGFPTKQVVVPALTAGEVRRINISLGDTGVDDWILY